METIRINKYLADCGVCSRREADKLIQQGRVKINGNTAEMGSRITSEDTITFNGKVLQGKEKNVVLAFYKPIGVTCTEKDKHAEKIINDYIKYPIRVTYAGRLDKDSEGLLLLTNDGALIDGIMRGANKQEKEYIVKVDKEITGEFLEKMSEGIFLKELKTKTRPCKIEMIGKYTFRILLTQGLNRQIRRMCGELGVEVRSLKRVRIMNIELGNLKSGAYREITGDELRELYLGAGMQGEINGNV